MIPSEKKRRLRRVRDGADQAKVAAETRDNRIRLALEDGLSIREVAEAASLSPARVHQIRHGK